MTVIKGTGFYHVEAARTNRQVHFSIVATGAGATNCFLFLKGNNAFPPWIGQNSAPTTNQLIAQYRADYVMRYLAQYAPIVEASIFETSVAADSLNIAFETYVGNQLPYSTTNESPGTGAGDITDLYGLADRVAKVKPGLQTLATNLLTLASLDGGTTLLFAADPNLSDGTASTAGVVSTLVVTALTPSMY